MKSYKLTTIIWHCFKIEFKKIIYNFGIIIPVLFCLTSCKKFLEIDPPKNQLVTSTVFTNDANAMSALAGLYIALTSNSQMGSVIISDANAITGIVADEYKCFNTSYLEFYNNSITSTNQTVKGLWGGPYNCIYQANAIIEGVNFATMMTPEVKKQITGEAKFIRAICHFYLTNIFGKVPIVITTDYRTVNVLPRADISKVYEQIILDLKDAELLLKDDYSASNNERTHPNKSAVRAFLSKVYLFKKDYIQAELESSKIISNTSLYDTVSVNSVFLKNSKEAIWQLMPNSITKNTDEGSFFILTRTPPTNVSISDGLYSAFEFGDKRKNSWIGSISGGGNTYYYPFKYKVRTGGSGSNPVVQVTEYSMVLRLAEQYLIRAEARAYQNKIVGLNSAQEDVNVIRKRAGLSFTNASNQAAMLLAIEKERRLELFGEWGWHRWFDLKRTGRADAVLTPVKGISWNSTDVFFPVPNVEILNNGNLGPQNEGY